MTALARRHHTLTARDRIWCVLYAAREALEQIKRTAGRREISMLLDFEESLSWVEYRHDPTKEEDR